MLAGMMGEGNSDKSFHTVLPITVSFILEVRELMRGFFQLLIISIPVTYLGTLSYQPMLSVSREAPGQAAQDRGQIPPGCICRKMARVCAGLAAEISIGALVIFGAYGTIFFFCYFSKDETKFSKK